MEKSDDRRAFAEAMRGVKPLGAEARAERRARPKAVARQKRAADAAVIAESLAPQAGLDEDHAFRRPGVAARTLRDLARGRFRIEDEIDLHGMTRAEAREALKAFIAVASARGHGCVRVIHGKGRGSGPAGPVLRGSVHGWLTQWDEVLAFAAPRIELGGSGAVCVLLRRRA